jgi:hypothetical protein
VKLKRLPKEALKNVLRLFRMGDSSLELMEPVESLKLGACKELEEYTARNDGFLL